MAGLYIHIPFCASRCIYCDFYSTTSRNRSHFIPRLLDEARASLAKFPTRTFRTVYIGGGTPSQLTPLEINTLINGLNEIFDLANVDEFTLEMNPEDVTPQYVAALPSAINRVSMGVQSFIDRELQLLHRRHDSRRPAEAVRILRGKGIQNISIDLMYGLPTQTTESFSRSIDAAIGLETQHISAYNLSVEVGTPLAKMVDNGVVSVADDELCNEMNALLRNKLRAAGFAQYEISNYARAGYESRHNSSYWDGTPYLGLGPGAHSYDGQCQRWWNEPNLAAYLIGQCPTGQETLSADDRYNERVMLGLRTARGVNSFALAKNHPSQYRTIFQPASRRLIDEGLLLADETSGDIRIAPDALHLADYIIRELMV